MRENKGSHRKVLYNANQSTKKLIDTDIEPFVAANFEIASNDLLVFRTNVKFVIQHCNWSIAAFFRSLNKAGIKTARENFIYGNSYNKFFPSILLIATFARLLGVTTAEILSENLPQLVAAGKVKPRINFPE